jgi:hypothetical protein
MKDERQYDADPWDLSRILARMRSTTDLRDLGCLFWEAVSIICCKDKATRIRRGLPCRNTAVQQAFYDNDALRRWVDTELIPRK